MIKRKRVIAILGTRPEFTKTALLIRHISKMVDQKPTIILTRQQDTLVNQTIDDLAIGRYANLVHMSVSDGSLWKESCEKEIVEFLNGREFDLGLIQGDTSSALLGAQSLKRRGVWSVHLEAGLRHQTESDLEPEEINRRAITKIANFHFAPNDIARLNLIAEGIQAPKIAVVGDLSRYSLAYIHYRLPNELRHLNEGKDIFEFARLNGCRPEIRTAIGQSVPIVVTLHRPGNRIQQENLLAAFQDLSERCATVTFSIISRPDTRWMNFYAAVRNLKNIVLLPPLSPTECYLLLRSARGLITDSAGLQQEALLMRKRVVVLRQFLELYHDHQLIMRCLPPFTTLTDVVMAHLMDAKRDQGVFPDSHWLVDSKRIAKEVLEL